MFFCIIAATLPIVMVITAIIARAKVQSRCNTTIPKITILIVAANPAFLVAAARSAVIGDGAPS